MKGNCKTVYCTLFFSFLVAAMYRPFPANFTDTCLDRIAIYVAEMVLRLTYLYPSQLCSTASCQLLLTRFSLGSLIRLVGPWTLHDPDTFIENVEIESVPTRVYLPYNRTNNGAIIFIHGGGFVLGNVEIYEPMVRQLAKDSGMLTFSIDYRLAPEHVFPAGLNDCERVVLHILQNGYKQVEIDRKRVALMGDSAGGGLVATITHHLRHRKDIPQPKAQILLYPLLQVHNLRTPSYEYYYQEMAGTAFVDPRLVAQYYLMYAGIDDDLNAKLTPLVLESKHLSQSARCGFEEYLDLSLVPEEFKSNQNATHTDYTHDVNASEFLAPFLENPDFTPLLQPDLSRLPKSLIVTMEYDVLRDEGIVYAKRLQRAGIVTTWKHFPTGFHAILNFNSIIETPRRILRYISRWTQENV